MGLNTKHDSLLLLTGMSILPSSAATLNRNANREKRDAEIDAMIDAAKAAIERR